MVTFANNNHAATTPQHNTKQSDSVWNIIITSTKVLSPILRSANRTSFGDELARTTTKMRDMSQMTVAPSIE